MAEWSKAVDLSPAWISTTEMCVGSNPTRVRILFLPFCFFFCDLEDGAWSIFLVGVGDVGGWRWRTLT
jgi:hypothetical protein